jgi:hypothetical protein
MNILAYVRHLWFALLVTALQVVVFRNLSLWDTGFVYLYIGAVLLLPIDLGAIPIMLFAFGLGLLNDMFYNTPGMHAAAAVLVAYARNMLLKLLTPAGGYEGEFEISLGYRGIGWYMAYMVPLILIHHVALFLLEYASLAKLHLVVLKAVVSGVLTLVLVTLVHQASGAARRGSIR